MNSLLHKSVSWRCPSNIALVKYWGKKDPQIPCNPSISMTLGKAVTEITLETREKSASGIELDYYFEGEKNAAFQKRVLNYLQTNSNLFSWLNDVALTVHSSNSFPHSTGIASSASAFGALALALLDISGNPEEAPGTDAFYIKASEFARLGSGSACRSVYGGFASWGEHPSLPGSSDLYATPIPEVHENFRDMKDAILIVDDQPKKVSSSVGHSLMKNHVYAENRFHQASVHTKRIIKTLYNGDYSEFIQITEAEALALHAMMMTSENYYLLMKSGTIHALEKITEFRNATGTPVCFTLDAGPNVHVLYPASVARNVEQGLLEELRPSLQGIIIDQTGAGPEKLN